MKKTIFVDIDGVMVTDWSLQQPVKYIDDYTYFEPYAPESVLAFNMIIDELNPLIVIHSSRRYQYSEASFKEIWRVNGIRPNNLQTLEKYAEMDDKWFDGPNPEKEYDIGRYIQLNNLKNTDYIVIEDEKLQVDNLCLVDGIAGFTRQDAQRIITSLTEGSCSGD